MDQNVLVAFLLTSFAGLSTGLGSLIVFFTRRPNMGILSFGLGFSTGVMVYISLAELLPEAQKITGEALGSGIGGWVATGFFFGGMVLSALIDKLVPEPENPHEATSIADIDSARDESEVVSTDGSKRSFARLGLLSALAIGIHNLPEGMATFASSMADLSLGASIAVAVAIHNIPEGISVAVPVYFATNSRKKALLYAFASGLAEPLGALLVFALLIPFINDAVLGSMLAFVAGIMVFISFDELLPTAKQYDKGHKAINGVVLGMAVMAASLLLF